MLTVCVCRVFAADCSIGPPGFATRAPSPPSHEAEIPAFCRSRQRQRARADHRPGVALHCSHRLAWRAQASLRERLALVTPASRFPSNCRLSHKESLTLARESTSADGRKKARARASSGPNRPPLPRMAWIAQALSHELLGPCLAPRCANAHRTARTQARCCANCSGNSCLSGVRGPCASGMMDRRERRWRGERVKPGPVAR